jgi:hypothetical protein
VRLFQRYINMMAKRGTMSAVLPSTGYRTQPDALCPTQCHCVKELHAFSVSLLSKMVKRWSEGSRRWTANEKAMSIVAASLDIDSSSSEDGKRTRKAKSWMSSIRVPDSLGTCD